MRSQPTKIRGPIALIRAKSGLVVGIARLVGSERPLTRANYMHYQDRHAIPASMLDEVIESGWVYPWVLEDARPLNTPLPSCAKPGAVKFVNLEPSVIDAIASTDGCFLAKRPEQIFQSTCSSLRPHRLNSPGDPSLPANKPTSPAAPPHLEELLFELRYNEAHASGRPARGREFLVLQGSTGMKNGSAGVKRDRYDRDRLVPLVVDSGWNIRIDATVT
jgi:hypothetical protein